MDFEERAFKTKILNSLEEYPIDFLEIIEALSKDGHMYPEKFSKVRSALDKLLKEGKIKKIEDPFPKYFI